MNLYRYYINGNKNYVVAESYAKAEEIIMNNGRGYIDKIQSIYLVQSEIKVQGILN